MTSSSAARTGRAIADSAALETLARAGHAANGVLHILIGALAISVATGAAATADQGGALAAVASTPFGAVLLWAMGIGLAALALWGFAEAVFFAQGSSSSERWKSRAKEAGKAAAYTVVSATAFRYAAGGSSDGDQAAQSTTSDLLGTPFGVVLVLIAALGVLAIGGYFVYKGARQKFLEDIRRPAGAVGSATTILGTVGYIAKGIALATVGILLAAAAVTGDASRSGGLDEALKALSDLPLGMIVLVIVGAGFVAYGAYCFVRARFARL